MKKHRTKKLSQRKKNKKTLKKLNCHEVLYKNLDWASEAAAYFGFSPLHFPEVTKSDRAKAMVVEKEEREMAPPAISHF